MPKLKKYLKGYRPTPYVSIPVTVEAKAVFIWPEFPERSSSFASEVYNDFIKRTINPVMMGCDLAKDASDVSVFEQFKIEQVNDPDNPDVIKFVAKYQPTIPV